MDAGIAIDESLLRTFLLGRDNMSHKGCYGHLLLVCGCDTMPGAAVLSTAAALKSGCGLVSLHTSKYAAAVSAVANPSAMLSVDEAPCFTARNLDIGRFNAIAAGPGLGRNPGTEVALLSLLSDAVDARIPMVLDADALNILSGHKYLLDCSHIPSGSVMTPHDGELQRLAGRPCGPDKLELAHELADRTGCTVVSKGYSTRICVPGNMEVYANTTGNPGLAKGGSGDVLTGLLAGLIARGYSSLHASMLAVWLHGYAGDRLSCDRTQEAFNSMDLVGYLHLGFLQLYAPHCQTHP